MVKVALLIGVSEYQPGLQPLPSAIEDVRSMERVLQHPEMGGFDRVEVLPNPNTQTMRIAIYSLFADCSSEDLVLFYFSGHGVKDQNRNLYLTTPETTKSQKGLVVPPTAVAASYLQTQINDSRSEHEVIILDCCYSGAIAKGLTAKDEGAVDIIAELGGKGRAILTSSTSVQSSFQQSGALSIYTQYLVEGIETGAADLDSDGQISADELHQYASKKVQQASPAMTPQFYPVEEGYRIYLARSPQDDPKLKYRKAVQKRAKKGEFTLIGRRILAHLQLELGLSQEEAETIEGEILRPYREYQQKLQEYKQVYREVVEQEYPLSDYTRNELKD
ncbi:MAG: caspase family protein, partial [Waterburya sp.]